MHYKRYRKLALTPLIDVIFLLLLFFMLASHFSNFGDVKISVATNATSSATIQQAQSHIQIGETVITIDDQPITAKRLPREIQKLFEEDNRRLFLVAPDEAVSTQRFISTLLSLKDIEGARLKITEGIK